MRLRHKKGTFSSDENNFLLTSPNRAVKEETKRLLFRSVGRGPEGAGTGTGLDQVEVRLVVQQRPPI